MNWVGGAKHQERRAAEQTRQRRSTRAVATRASAPPVPSFVTPIRPQPQNRFVTARSSKPQRRSFEKLRTDRYAAEQAREWRDEEHERMRVLRVPDFPRSTRRRVDRGRDVEEADWQRMRDDYEYDDRTMPAYEPDEHLYYRHDDYEYDSVPGYSYDYQNAPQSEPTYDDFSHEEPRGRPQYYGEHSSAFGYHEPPRDYHHRSRAPPRPRSVHEIYDDLHEVQRPQPLPRPLTRLPPRPLSPLSVVEVERAVPQPVYMQAATARPPRPLPQVVYQIPAGFDPALLSQLQFYQSFNTDKLYDAESRFSSNGTGANPVQHVFDPPPFTPANRRPQSHQRARQRAFDYTLSNQLSGSMPPLAHLPVPRPHYGSLGVDPYSTSRFMALPAPPVVRPSTFTSLYGTNDEVEHQRSLVVQRLEDRGFNSRQLPAPAWQPTRQQPPRAALPDFRAENQIPVAMPQPQPMSRQAAAAPPEMLHTMTSENLEQSSPLPMATAAQQGQASHNYRFQLAQHTNSANDRAPLHNDNGQLRSVQSQGQQWPQQVHQINGSTTVLHNNGIGNNHAPTGTVGNRSPARLEELEPSPPPSRPAPMTARPAKAVKAPRGLLMPADFVEPQTPQPKPLVVQPVIDDVTVQRQLQKEREEFEVALSQSADAMLDSAKHTNTNTTNDVEISRAMSHLQPVAQQQVRTVTLASNNLAAPIPVPPALLPPSQTPVREAEPLAPVTASTSPKNAAVTVTASQPCREILTVSTTPSPRPVAAAPVIQQAPISSADDLDRFSRPLTACVLFLAINDAKLLSKTLKICRANSLRLVQSYAECNVCLCTENVRRDQLNVPLDRLRFHAPFVAVQFLLDCVRTRSEQDMWRYRVEPPT